MDTLAPDKISALLAGTYRDPETGEAVSVGTRSLVIFASLAGREAQLIRDLDFGPKLAVVSDRTTHQVLGARIERALGGKAQSIVLDAGVHPDGDAVAAVQHATQGADALIAVG